MAALSSILRSSEGGGLAFRCPGCNRTHRITVGQGGWSWNGNAELPTFTPSILVSYDGADAGRNGAPPAVCHSYVTNGRIQFLGDTTHALAGHTVDIPPFDEEGV